MEILYIWVKSFKLIKEQGINFGGKYLLDIKKNDKKNEYILSVKKNSSYIEEFFDKNKVISNITAIVGENGSGKTSLLNAIYNNMKDNIIIAYMDRNSVYIHHTVDNLRLEKSSEEANIINMKTLSRDQNITILRYKLFSYIYLTNSMYENNFGFFERDIDIQQLQLSPISINNLAYKFYNKILPKAKSIYSQIPIGNDEYLDDEEFSENEGFNFFQNLILEELISNNSFQQICDLQYYYYLFSQELEKKYIGKVVKNIKVNIVSILEIENHFKEKYEDKETQGYSPNGNVSDFAKKQIDTAFQYHGINTVFLNKNNDIIEVLLHNLTFELISIIQISEKNDILKRYGDYNGLIKELFKKLSDDESEQYDYYENAYNEILEFKEIIRSKDVEKDYTDDFHNRTVKFTFMSQNKDIYDNSYFKFLKFINKCVLSTKSFILKYINIDGLIYSSGERAMQNFFSWLNLLQWFECIEGNMLNGLKDNVLLLIDEIDLYSHPEWQRVFIKKLIDNLIQQLRRNKVQVVFTTHSPLVLSDIPCNNTIYMKKTENGCEVDKKKENYHKETFASDLYTLLNDSFYLKNGTIGEFARDKIKYIIKSLSIDNNKNNSKEKKRILDDKELNIIENEILIIGDYILRDKLLEMLDEYKFKIKDMSTNKRIQELEKKKEELQKHIDQLKGKKK
ncbi:ATP-binding cassette domain-containing protein [Clostridium botulinum]|nr:ATP-binding cassette domain-containing protein [Clostridium botulinum]NFS52683.1 ATP-binding cassette domain-containing protein [Clostridium botulinum]NFT16598.1 ATP-binding cassette domain-containing protein [Clostridium botulinum]